MSVPEADVQRTVFFLDPTLQKKNNVEHGLVLERSDPHKRLSRKRNHSLRRQSSGFVGILASFRSFRNWNPEKVRSGKVGPRISSSGIFEPSAGRCLLGC